MAEAVSNAQFTHPMLTPVQAMRMKKGKIISAEEAVSLIRDGDTIATEGFVGAGFPEEIVIQLKEHFLRTGGPRKPHPYLRRRAGGRQNQRPEPCRASTG